MHKAYFAKPEDAEAAYQRLFSMRDKLAPAMVAIGDWDVVHDALTDPEELSLQIGCVFVQVRFTVPWYSNTVVLQEVVTVRNYDGRPDWALVFAVVKSMAGECPVVWGNTQQASGMDAVLLQHGAKLAGSLYWVT